MDSGTRMLVQMASARRFNRWMADTIAPFVKGDVLEAGAGIGNLTEFLFRPGSRYVAADLEEEHLEQLTRRMQSHPGVTIAKCDLLNSDDLAPYREQMDTVVCLNVLEHVDDDVAGLRSLRSCLRCGGRAVVLVPQAPRAYGSLDRVLGHHRRYSKSELHAKLLTAGFHLDRMIEFNRITYPGWILNSRILRRTTLSSTQLRCLDFLVPLWRRIDDFLPWPSTSLIAIASRDGC
jgi:2-polyprenyl-3-methyl-5-hydroxy-6-metoxy-1,4-benzoquinol methylase